MKSSQNLEGIRLLINNMNLTSKNMFKNFVPVTASISALCSLLITGCAVSISDLSKQSHTQAAIKQEQNGLEANISPLTDVSEIRREFGTDLIGRGILPVFVTFKNFNTNESFLIMPDKCHLEVGGSLDEQAKGKPKTTTAGGATQLVGATLVSAPLLVIGAIITTDAMSANHQFTVNQLGT